MFFPGSYSFAHSMPASHLTRSPLDRHELLDELRSKHMTLIPTQKITLTHGVPHMDHVLVPKNLSNLCTQIDLKVDNYNMSSCGNNFFGPIDQKVEAEGGVNSIQHTHFACD